jgi:hypothetical protein
MSNILYNFIPKSKLDLLMNICKVIIIVISAIYLLGNFTPFYEGSDSYLYGLFSVNLSQGIFEISNPLFEETNKIGFSGTNWIPTVHDTMIPIGGIGTPVLGTIAFIMGGYYGLFYVGPILGILLLIIYERISSNLFGKYVGLLALLFFASCHIFFRSAILPNTDAMLALFFIPGIYYLIKFLKTGDERKIFLTSVFFVLASLIKTPALVYLPLELVIIAIYFIIQVRRNKITVGKSDNPKILQKTLFTINRNKLFKIAIFVIIPWIVFFSFWLSYNDYFFGDPTTTYFEVLTGDANSQTSRTQSLLVLEQRDYDQFKDYGKYLLPYQISAAHNRINNNLDDTLGSNWPGLLIIPLFALSLFLSFKIKSHRIELSVFIFFIFGILAFYSGQTPEERAELGLPARYMFPIIPLAFLIWSYIIVQGLEKLKTYQNTKQLRIFALVFIGGFFILAFSFTPPIQFFVDGNFTNPLEAVERYPLDKENISSKSILLVQNTDYAIEYGSVPFKLSNTQTWDSEKILILTNVLKDNYSIYTFKISKSISEHQNLVYLINNNNFVLREFSDTFCQLIVNDGTMSNDEICISKIVQHDRNKQYDLPFLN